MIFKTLVSLLLFSSISLFAYNFPCDCNAVLTKSFNDVEKHIVDDNLNYIEENIEKTINSLDKNILELEKNIELLKEANKGTKLEILQLHDYNNTLVQYKETLNKKFSLEDKKMK